MTQWASGVQLIKEVCGAKMKETFRENLKRLESIMGAAETASAHQIPPGSVHLSASTTPFWRPGDQLNSMGFELR